jgi:hypothetical protein
VIAEELLPAQLAPRGDPAMIVFCTIMFSPLVADCT